MSNEKLIVSETPLRNVKNNIVQSIRAHRVDSLQAAAQDLGHHFLYANLGNAQSREEVVQSIREQFMLPENNELTFDAISECITDRLHKSGAQTGFVVVLEQIPTNPRFDKESRESLLDVFRDSADYWADRKIPFRCFYSYSVARAAKAGEKVPEVFGATDEHPGEVMPTNKIFDVSPQALRMSSPFNAGYWLSSAADNARSESAAA